MADIGKYDTLNDFALSERRLLQEENKSLLLDVYESPDKAKWENRDCQHCLSIFSVIKSGKVWICRKCGR